MFNDNLKSEIKSLQRDLDDLRTKYWILRENFGLLLNHLGVYIDTVPEHRIIMKGETNEKATPS